MATGAVLSAVLWETPGPNLGAAGAFVLGSGISLLLTNVKNIARLALPLFGRSIPIDVVHATMFSEFAPQHPRLAEIAGKWMADNPDNKLNINNLYRMEKAYRKIQRLEGKPIYPPPLVP